MREGEEIFDELRAQWEEQVGVAQIAELEASLRHSWDRAESASTPPAARPETRRLVRSHPPIRYVRGR